MTPGSYRASDADRDQVAEVLNSAYAEGRLTLDEHQERSQAALVAKTFDDLTTLMDRPGAAAGRCRCTRTRRATSWW